MSVPFLKSQAGKTILYELSKKNPNFFPWVSTEKNPTLQIEMELPLRKQQIIF